MSRPRQLLCAAYAAIAVLGISAADRAALAGIGAAVTAVAVWTIAR